LGHPLQFRPPDLYQDADSRFTIGERDEATVLAKLARQVPLGRLGEADDVANGILYLASDESRFMTGAELKLDGGISAK
jgi:NAD(P)-dependent dehydrogenase (short-subunit alcohol dehydrogenase family)